MQSVKAAHVLHAWAVTLQTGLYDLKHIFHMVLNVFFSIHLPLSLKSDTVNKSCDFADFAVYFLLHPFFFLLEHPSSKQLRFISCKNYSQTRIFSSPFEQFLLQIP